MNINGLSITPGADLAGADLSDTSLASKDLSKARMAGVALAGSDLTEARLVGADLRYSICHKAVFDKADLHHANLWNIDLRGASAKVTNFCKCWSN